MKLQHRIHEMATEIWPRCTRVEVKGDRLYCELDLDRQYDLVDAYRRDPHIQFLNCKSCDDLKSFTRAWGPLYLVETPGAEERKLGIVVRRVAEIQAHRRWLHAIRGMVDACRHPGDERAALIEFLNAEIELEEMSNTYQPGKESLFHQMFRLRFQFQVNSNAWVLSTDIGSVRQALAFSVEANVQGPPGSLRVEQKGRRCEIKPRFTLVTLWDTLRWMVWLDEWNRSPLLCCLECRKFFRPLTAHEMKYCTHQCAHRASNREWRRRDLREQKKRLKIKTKEGTNGPHKAR
jgi:hypothetical protein